MRRSRSVFVTRTVTPVPGFEKEGYVIKGGKTRAQVERHIVRDTLTVWRKRWDEQERQIVAAALKEQATAHSGSEEARAKKKALKAEIAAQKKAYFEELDKKAKEERSKVKALRVEFWKRREAVLADARKEMVKALTEDETLWNTHPREMMNRRYQTVGAKMYKTAYN